VQLLRRYSLAEKLQSQTVSREKLLKTLLNKKAARKIFVILTPEEKRKHFLGARSGKTNFMYFLHLRFPVSTGLIKFNLK